MILIDESLFPFFGRDFFRVSVDLTVGICYDDEKEGELYGT